LDSNEIFDSVLTHFATEIRRIHETFPSNLDFSLLESFFRGQLTGLPLFVDTKAWSKLNAYVAYLRTDDSIVYVHENLNRDDPSKPSVQILRIKIFQTDLKNFGVPENPIVFHEKSAMSIKYRGAPVLHIQILQKRLKMFRSEFDDTTKVSGSNALNLEEIIFKPSQFSCIISRPIAKPVSTEPEEGGPENAVQLQTINEEFLDAVWEKFPGRSRALNVKFLLGFFAGVFSNMRNRLEMSFGKLSLLGFLNLVLLPIDKTNKPSAGIPTIIVGRYDRRDTAEDIESIAVYDFSRKYTLKYSCISPSEFLIFMDDRITGKIRIRTVSEDQIRGVDGQLLPTVVLGTSVKEDELRSAAVRTLGRAIAHGNKGAAEIDQIAIEFYGRISADICMHNMQTSTETGTSRGAASTALMLTANILSFQEMDDVYVFHLSNKKKDKSHDLIISLADRNVDENALVTLIYKNHRQIGMKMSFHLILVGKRHAYDMPGAFSALKELYDVENFYVKMFSFTYRDDVQGTADTHYVQNPARMINIAITDIINTAEANSVIRDPVFSAEEMISKLGGDFDDPRFVDRMLTVLFVRAGNWLKIDSQHLVMALAESVLRTVGRVAIISDYQLEVVAKSSTGNEVKISRKLKLVPSNEVPEYLTRKVPLVVEETTEEKKSTEIVVYKDEQDVLHAAVCYSNS